MRVCRQKCLFLFQTNNGFTQKMRLEPLGLFTQTRRANVMRIRTIYFSVSSTFMVGQCRCLPISLITYVTCVWFVVGMDHVMLV